jgi:hypothetical protein
MGKIVVGKEKPFSFIISTQGFQTLRRSGVVVVILQIQKRLNGEY